MAENTGIEWCDHTFNPWIGCTAVSPACDHCYAETLATTRLGVPWGPHAQRRRTGPQNWNLPRRWNAKAQREGRRARVFCASLADVFDNAVPEDWRIELWRLIRETPHLDWLLLTKRPGNIRKMLPSSLDHGDAAWSEGPWPNVWLGTTVEDQQRADERIPKLLAVPAAVRFLSCEPLLGPVDLTNITGAEKSAEYGSPVHGWSCIWRNNGLGRPWIDWVIAGGESGTGSRPTHPDWFRSLRDQCASAGVAFFFKQHGDWVGVPDLRRLPGGSGPGFGAFDHSSYDQQHDAVRVGKKRAGSLLDGVQHRQWPAR